jgi:dienelactone hydrolase
LVCTGADDSFVGPKAIAAFEQEMRDAGVDWELVSYGAAHHAFTNPDADKHHLPNIAYNESADRRSWAAMRGMFDEVFGPMSRN